LTVHLSLSCLSVYMWCQLFVNVHVVSVVCQCTCGVSCLSVYMWCQLFVSVHVVSVVCQFTCGVSCLSVWSVFSPPGITVLL
jgi:hypothetical protein